MKVDAGLGSLAEAADRAPAIERAGFDGAWSAEVTHDPFLPLAIAAEHTTTLELGTSIAVAFSRSPMSLAYTAHDLQAFSGGRLLLGLGSQVKAHITRRFDMKWGRPAPQMHDFVLAMRAIWSAWADGTPLSYESEHYRHTLMTPNFVPPPHPYGAPKVLIAGVGDVMTRVAGEVADGFLCHGFTTARYVREHTLPALEEGRKRAGLDMAGFEVLATAFVATGRDDREIAESVERVKSQIAFYGSTPAYRGVLELHGWGALGEDLTRLSKEGRWDDMGKLVDDDVVDAFAVVAPPDRLAAEIGARYGGLVTRLSFTPPAWLAPDASRELLEAIRAL